MNVESIISKIALFNELVVESGFKRDLQDYQQSIQQAQNKNLTFLKDISLKLSNYYSTFENNSLESELQLLLKESTSFLEIDALEELYELDNDSEIVAANYFSKLNQLLARLKQSVDSNTQELDEVERLFSKYMGSDDISDESNEKALMSLIFKDLKTTKSMKEFSKVLNRWNRTLLIYHSLLKAESPEEISLVEIQNGSIDVIFNIDFDIAIDLTELIKTGLKVFGGYLLYKSKLAQKTIESFMGSEKLIELEEKKEVLMLDNVKESVKRKALEQHTEHLELHPNIDKTGIDAKVEEVSTVITDHIIKGNEVKLLTAPVLEDNEEDDEDRTLELSRDLREETAIVREGFKSLGDDDKLMLLEKYGIPEEKEEVKKPRSRKAK